MLRLPVVGRSRECEHEGDEQTQDSTQSAIEEWFRPGLNRGGSRLSELEGRLLCQGLGSGNSVLLERLRCVVSVARL